MTSQKKVSFLAAALLVCTTAFVIFEVLRIQQSQTTQAHVQYHSVPSLRYLEQMRFGVARVVSSTSELIVIHIPHLVASTANQPLPYDPAEEEELIEEGYKSFEDAYAKLVEIAEEGNQDDHQTLSRSELKALQDNYNALKTKAEEIISSVKQGVPLEEILELKEAFEIDERKNLVAIESALQADQQRTDTAFQALSSELSLLANLITVMGVGIGFMVLFFASYTIAALKKEAKSRETAEQLAKEKEAEVDRRKQLEANLAAHQKLEALGTMLGGIAHSVNNYLMPIMTLTKMAQQDVPEGSELQQDLQRVYSSAQNASIVLKDVMAFSRSDNQISENRCEIVACVSKALNITKAATPSSVQVESNISATESWIAAKEADIEALLLNLASNATDAMEAATGRLSIQLDNIILGEESLLKLGLSIAPGPMVHLSISDTGRGIDASHLTRIFDPFFTTKEVGKGTGLGLSVSHTTVKQAGGDIKVSSEINKGTRFDIYLPLMEGSSAQP